MFYTNTYFDKQTPELIHIYTEERNFMAIVPMVTKVMDVFI